MTFSIAAYDPNENAFGIGVASKFIAVGAVVPWARAGVGAVATQALAKVGYGADGLALLAQGKSARETLAMLLASDPAREHRQVGLVDRHGEAAAHTGSECHAYAGHIVREGYTCQGNILAGAPVLEAMDAAYASARGELADRLVVALLAADEAGGDRRGRQGAAVLVVRPNGGYGGDNDRYLDLRVDDDPNPLPKLTQLVQTHHIFFGAVRPDDQIPITESLARELQYMMRAQGYYTGEITGVWDLPSMRAFWALVGNENLEERWNLDQHPDHIDRPALDYLRQRFGSA